MTAYQSLAYIHTFFLYLGPPTPFTRASLLRLLIHSQTDSAVASLIPFVVYSFTAGHFTYRHLSAVQFRLLEPNRHLLLLLLRLLLLPRLGGRRLRRQIRLL